VNGLEKIWGKIRKTRGKIYSLRTTEKSLGEGGCKNALSSVKLITQDVPFLSLVFLVDCIFILFQPIWRACTGQSSDRVSNAHFTKRLWGLFYFLAHCWQGHCLDKAPLIRPKLTKVTQSAGQYASSALFRYYTILVHVVIFQITSNRVKSGTFHCRRSQWCQLNLDKDLMESIKKYLCIFEINLIY